VGSSKQGSQRGLPTLADLLMSLLLLVRDIKAAKSKGFVFLLLCEDGFCSVPFFFFLSEYSTIRSS